MVSKINRIFTTSKLSTHKHRGEAIESFRNFAREYKYMHNQGLQIGYSLEGKNNTLFHAHSGSTSTICGAKRPLRSIFETGNDRVAGRSEKLS